MNLKTLNINFINRDEFLSDLKGALFNSTPTENKDNDISFDSIETFKRIMNQNKLEILMAISRLKPKSIYQLKKFVNRTYPPVLKDCKQLESLGFIKLTKGDQAKKQLRPELIFDYDIIRVNSKLEEFFSISELSNRVLKNALVG